MSRSFCQLSGEGHSLQRPGRGVQFGVLQPGLARGTAAQSKGGLTGLDGDKPRSLLTESQRTADFEETLCWRGHLWLREEMWWGDARALWRKMGWKLLKRKSRGCCVSLCLETILSYRCLSMQILEPVAAMWRTKNRFSYRYLLYYLTM